MSVMFGSASRLLRMIRFSLGMKSSINVMSASPAPFVNLILAILNSGAATGSRCGTVAEDSVSGC